MTIYQALSMKPPLLALALLLSSSPALAQELWLPPIFADHMVVQREKPVRVWGKAAPGSVIRVSMAGREATAAADADGRWMADLPPLPAGGPHELSVAGPSTRTFRDVLVGEVWLASGQSNMEWSLEMLGHEEEIAASANPRIRMLTVRRNVSDTPLEDFQTEGWQLSAPEVAGGFSGVAYYFAKELEQALGVPVGIVHSSWGGTVAEAWTSAGALRNLPDFRGRVDEIRPGSISLAEQARINDRLQAETAAWERRAAEADVAAGRQEDWITGRGGSGWRTLTAPGAWEEQGLPDFDGIVWLRRQFSVPRELTGREVTLRLGQITGRDSVWINGRFIGQLARPDRSRAYAVPAGVLRRGRNTIVVRVLNERGPGGLLGPAEEMRVEIPGGRAVSLAGEWQYRPTGTMASIGESPRGVSLHNQPTALYNAMISPIRAYQLRGVIWYQGESNASRAEQYRTLFPALIRDWRAQLGDDHLPFLFVQLANFMPAQPDPNTPSDWALLREAQARTLALPGTGMAVTIDIGDPEDIHPRNKEDVGKRLALIALNRVYGVDVPYSGPVYREMEIEGDAIRLHFDHAEGGLMAHGGELRGFAIAGNDGVFHWADARIEGNTVVVSSPAVPHPVAVRYAWADNPQATLYNAEGLPAVPFRTGR